MAKQLYKWRVDYTGKSLTQDEWDSWTRDVRCKLDPQLPQPQWGVPLRVVLVPQKEGLKPIIKPVPAGCLPVRCYQNIELNYKTGDKLQGRFWKVGFNAGGRQFFDFVHMKTGERFPNLYDEDGFRYE